MMRWGLDWSGGFPGMQQRPVDRQTTPQHASPTAHIVLRIIRVRDMGPPGSFADRFLARAGKIPGVRLVSQH
jgi:hypothetical protein